MPRRNGLKNIASGLYGSFISRNNDVAGYWGIGKLCLFAQQNGVQIVHIDLLAKSITPASSAFSKLIYTYDASLSKDLSTVGIPENWLTSAAIALDFKPQLSEKQIPVAATWGSLFKLVVNITGDRMKNHTVSGYGYCGAHNPNGESKSART